MAGYSHSTWWLCLHARVVLVLHTIAWFVQAICSHELLTGWLQRNWVFDLAQELLPCFLKKNQDTLTISKLKVGNKVGSPIKVISLGLFHSLISKSLLYSNFGVQQLVSRQHLKAEKWETQSAQAWRTLENSKPTPSICRWKNSGSRSHNHE